jgi:hypothetical protein
MLMNQQFFNITVNFGLYLILDAKKISMSNFQVRNESYTILDYTGVSSFYLVEDLIT